MNYIPKIPERGAQCAAPIVFIEAKSSVTRKLLYVMQHNLYLNEFQYSNLAELILNKIFFQISDDILAEFREQFSLFDQDGNGHISTEELESVMQSLGE